MSRLHQNIRVVLSMALVGLGVSLSEVTWAQALPYCDDNVSPPVSCTNLLLTDSNLTIVNNVLIEGIAQPAIYDYGENNSITNNGTIFGVTEIPGAGAVWFRGTSLSNLGTIYTGGAFASVVMTGYDENTSLYNSGRIGTEDGVLSLGNSTITNYASIRNFNNSGLILADSTAVLNEYGAIGSLVNNGQIESRTFVAVLNNGYIDSILNNNAIRVNEGGSAILNNLNEAVIGRIENTGSITGVDFAIYNFGSINTITNTGSIYSLNSGNPSIGNDIGSVITTLNNAQGVGNVHGALTYSGVLPTNYNIIFNNPTSYGKLDASAFTVTGVTNFGIYAGSALTKGTYAAVLSGLTSSNVSSTSRSGFYNGTAWTLALKSGSTTIWDLIVQSSATNTLASVQQNSASLATVYNQQAAAYQAALSYDCQVYDQAGLCVSVGGRYTYAGPSPSSNQQAGLVILGYKPAQTLRVGAFADQSVNISTPSGFSQSKSSPMWGFFAKWHKNKDETGLGVQASAVTSSSSLTSTRPQLFNTETGSGTTQFNGQGYQLTTNYHQPVTNNTSLVPYLGLRYTRINAGAYTENITATVTSPLSYNAMAQNTFSAIGGIGVRSHLAEKLTGTASVGIQQNLNYSMGNYAGTSNITGLESFSVQMPGNVNSMATASAGLYYDVRKNERVGLNVLWQQQPFIASNTTTALATYTIGF